MIDYAFHLIMKGRLFFVFFFFLNDFRIRFETHRAASSSQKNCYCSCLPEIEPFHTYFIQNSMEHLGVTGLLGAYELGSRK